LDNVWVAFCRLSNARASGFSGPSPITYTQIKDWMELTYERLSPREIEVLMKLDQTYLRIANG
jgi:hypothetical protein